MWHSYNGECQNIFRYVAPCRLLERYRHLEPKCCLRRFCRIWLKQVTPKRLLTSIKSIRHHFSEEDKFHRHLFPLSLQCLMLWPTERWTKWHTNLWIVCCVHSKGEGAAMLQAQDTDGVLISLTCFLRLRTILRPRKESNIWWGWRRSKLPQSSRTALFPTSQLWHTSSSESMCR